ncbi:MAG: diguanylate cyclase [Sphingomonadales bacterium]|nr:diguanylate cyclase [Sphingomonadales bacterium]MDE2167918.1 diguanylate cyclase [Sphingomonadales bacterium]
MSLVHAADGKSDTIRFAAKSRVIFLIEDSEALGRLLMHRIAQQTDVEVKWFKTYREAQSALNGQRPALAVSRLSLPDAIHGEILELLAGHEVPVILCTATLNRAVRDRFAANIVDYFLLDAQSTLDSIVSTVVRFTQTVAPPVLVVDDSATGRTVLVDLLNRQNYRTFEAASGKEALKLLATHPDIQLVITDYHMADMDGHMLTQEIRTRFAPDRIRVIGISSSSDPFLSASFLKAGASDFVYRPFIAEEVQYRIQSNLQTLEQMRNLRFMAERDPLTGLYNRRAFFEQAYTILDELCGQADGEGTVAILDIDHFKRVNDNYGHDAGDKVIKAVARMLADHCQDGTTTIARFGGEEFVLLFKGLPYKAVQARCEEIRATIAKLAIPYDSSAINLTVSIGAAILQLGEGIDNNLNAADQMLYMAKNGGRNRLVYDAVFCEN